MSCELGPAGDAPGARKLFPLPRPSGNSFSSTGNAQSEHPCGFAAGVPVFPLFPVQNDRARNCAALAQRSRDANADSMGKPGTERTRRNVDNFRRAVYKVQNGPWLDSLKNEAPAANPYECSLSGR